MTAVYEQMSNIDGVYKAIVASKGNTKEEKIAAAVDFLKEGDLDCRGAARFLASTLTKLKGFNSGELAVIKVTPDSYVVPVGPGGHPVNDSVVDLGWLVGPAKIISFVLTSVGFKTKVISQNLRTRGAGDHILYVCLD